MNKPIYIIALASISLLSIQNSNAMTFSIGSSSKSGITINNPTDAIVVTQPGNSSFQNTSGISISGLTSVVVKLSNGTVIATFDKDGLKDITQIDVSKDEADKYGVETE